MGGILESKRKKRKILLVVVSGCLLFTQQQKPVVWRVEGVLNGWSMDVSWPVCVPLVKGFFVCLVGSRACVNRLHMLSSCKPAVDMRNINKPRLCHHLASSHSQFGGLILFWVVGGGGGVNASQLYRKHGYCFYHLTVISVFMFPDGLIYLNSCLLSQTISGLKLACVCSSSEYFQCFLL